MPALKFSSFGQWNCSVVFSKAVADPDLQIRGGGGGHQDPRGPRGPTWALSQNFFPGGHAGPGPRAPLLDPPLKRSCHTFVSHI